MMWRVEPDWFVASRMDIYYELWEDDHCVELRCKVCGNRDRFPLGSDFLPSVVFVSAAQHMIECPRREGGKYEPTATTR